MSDQRVFCFKFGLFIDINCTIQRANFQLCKAGHRSTLRPCVFAFWHSASVYVRLSAFFRGDESSTCVSTSSRTMLAFGNNASCSSSACSAQDCVLSQVTWTWILWRPIAPSWSEYAAFVRKRRIIHRSRPVCACFVQLPRLRGNAGTCGSICGRLKSNAFWDMTLTKMPRESLFSLPTPYINPFVLFYVYNIYVRNPKTLATPVRIYTYTDFAIEIWGFCRRLTDFYRRITTRGVHVLPVCSWQPI